LSIFKKSATGGNNGLYLSRFWVYKEEPTKRGPGFQGPRGLVEKKIDKPLNPGILEP
jgi:hypothetical protein